MEFKEWIKIKEEAGAGAPPAAAAPGATTSAAPTTSVSNSGSTSSSDIAKVPQRMFSNKRQTSDKCQNCSKDFWKNWHYTKKKRKK
jgi:hypothetical protein